MSPVMHYRAYKKHNEDPEHGTIHTFFLSGTGLFVLLLFELPQIATAMYVLPPMTHQYWFIVRPILGLYLLGVAAEYITRNRANHQTIAHIMVIPNAIVNGIIFWVMHPIIVWIYIANVPYVMVEKVVNLIKQSWH